MEKAELKRSISLPVLFLYGLGTMVGGGFYALSGKVAGMAGYAAPFAFLIAGVLAFINVFTFSELSSRYPVSAGEAKYAYEGFKRNGFAGIVGWLVILTGVVSAATLSVATIGFLQDLFPSNEALGIIIIVLVMGFICAIGIGESVKAVLIITVIEVGALLYIIFSKGANLVNFSDVILSMDSYTGGFPLIGILAGAFLAFYAFIGFEDMVNIAEEIKDVRKTLPKALISSVIATTIIYFIVVSTMVLTVNPADLTEAKTPLAKIIESDGMRVNQLFIIISMLTGINGALVQIVMASRVMYGLAKNGTAPKSLGKVHTKTQTPVYATILATTVVLSLALFFPLVKLAEATSFIILIIFSIMNLALIKIKHSKTIAHDKAKSYSILLPYIAFVFCAGILIFRITQLI